jgi:hypothetical protein
LAEAKAHQRDEHLTLPSMIGITMKDRNSSTSISLTVPALIVLLCVGVLWFRTTRTNSALVQSIVPIKETLPLAAREAVTAIVKAHTDLAGIGNNELRREYAKLLAKLTPEQKKQLLDLVAAEKAIIGQRDEGLRDGRFASRKDANAFVKGQVNNDENALKALLGADLFSEYRDETDQVPIHQFVGIFSAAALAQATPMTSDQTSYLEDSFLEAYKLINPDLLWFDPTVYQLTTPTYYQDVLQRSLVYNAVEKDAATYLSPDQASALTKFLQMQTQVAIRARPLGLQH